MRIRAGGRFARRAKPCNGLPSPLVGVGKPSHIDRAPVVFIETRSVSEQATLSASLAYASGCDVKALTATARPPRRALTLVELLLVIAILGIIAGALLPRFQPAVSEQLVSTARTIAADVMYCRDLAVSNSSQYTLTFDTVNNRYHLEHSGANSSLDDLPAQPFSSTGSTATRHVIKLDEMPHLAAPVRLVAVESIGSTTEPVTTLELGPLGETTRSEPTRVWLGCGSGSEERFIYLEIDPVTGLVQESDLQAQAPPTY